MIEKIKEIEKMRDDEGMIEKTFDAIDRLGEKPKPEKDDEPRKLPVCPGCKKVAWKTRSESIGYSAYSAPTIGYYCDCGYQGPIVWIDVEDIENGKAKIILKNAEERFTRENKR